MRVTTHAHGAIVRLRSLLLVSLPPAVGFLLATRVFQLQMLVVLALCGMVVAVVGGCTKIGSA